MNENKKLNSMNIAKSILRIVAYLTAVVAVFFVVNIKCTVNQITINKSENSIVDLTQINFTNDIAVIHSNTAVIYDGIFYYPQDFAGGHVDDANQIQGDFGTVRYVLSLPAEHNYMISAKNASYAQRLFINGREYPPVGVTGTSAESVIPKTTRYAAAFEPKSDITEIIIHYSNFVHADTGGIYPMSLGYAENITRLLQLNTLKGVTIAATLTTSMLAFWGIFLFSSRNRYFLWFSLLSACASLRFLLIDDKIIMLLLPNLDWFLSIRLEYLSTLGVALFFALFIESLFSGAVNIWAMRGFVVYIVTAMVFVFLSPPILFTRFIYYELVLILIFFAYMTAAIIWSAFRKSINQFLKGEKRILLSGCVLGFLLACFSVYAHSNSIMLLGIDPVLLGTAILIFSGILVMALRYYHTEHELNIVRISERKMEETNRMMKYLDKLKSEFMASISHELKTPLSVISGYAQLTTRQIDGGTISDDTRKNLKVISQEASRLAELATGLLKAVAEGSDWNRELLNVNTILDKAYSVCSPILVKNGNHLDIIVESNLPRVCASGEMIHQVLLNLLTNANHYTRDSSISINAGLSHENDSIFISVTDTGKGIEPDLISHVFERGISGRGSTGIGLAICKEIVEAHGGQIYAKSKQNQGTCITFTLPAEKGGE